MALILIVDDSPLIREMVTSLLKEIGHTVRIAQRSRYAMEMIRADSYDLILMDLNMPGIRGEVTIRTLRQNLRLETPIIVLSGEITKEILLSLKDLDISGFVAKTEDFDVKLLEEVDKALNA